MRCFDQSSRPDDYERWRSENAASYIVNCAGGRWMVHRASCSHLDQFSAFDADLLKSPKVCSQDRDELHRVAAAFGRKLVSCTNCCPESATAA